MLIEKISKHLGVKYIYLPEKKLFLCENGVPFTLEEYRQGIDLPSEYKRRKYEGKLFDYNYAKSTGLLRKKRGYSKMLSGSSTVENEAFEKIITENPSITEQISDNTERSASGDSLPSAEPESFEEVQERSSGDNEETRTELDKQEEIKGKIENGNVSDGRAVGFIIALLAFTSLISGYISTLHTATYLYDYVDMISAWLMSASVTAYNATAFEVSVIFKSKKRYGLTFVFIMLWGMVTLFSMATTVSVFYDRFNFTETQIAEENKQADSNKLALELLQKKESDLRESIEFKKKDIEYRQERDYATTAVRTELNKLQEELQTNLTEQQSILETTPEITEETLKRKESLFAFLGRILHIEGGVLEFIMSTLSAIFVNIISPMSLVAVTELLNKRLD